MKGLLLKDLLNQKYQLKIFVLLFVFWAGIAITGKNNSMMAAFIPMLALILTLNAMAFDDKNKWDKFAVTMPISRFDIVFSKYIFNAAVTFLGLIIAFMVDAFLKSPVEENILVCVASFSASLIVASIMIPIIYKFGIEKARLVIMLIIVIPVLLISVLPTLNLPMPQISESGIITAVSFSPVVALIITFISVKISEKIFNSKDF